MKQEIEKVLFSEEQLKSAVKKIAGEINRDYEGKEPVLIGILKGSVVFMADRMREISVDCTTDFMSVSSYGGGTETSGSVRIRKDLDRSITGKDVIVIEDILDSGTTLSHLLEILEVRRPNSLKLCVLLDKPERRVTPVKYDYVGLTVPDEFIVGYGLDYDEKYRNLPYIGVLKREVYEK